MNPIYKCVVTLLMSAILGVAQAQNVALDKPVTLDGVFGVPIENTYSHGPLAPASTITDCIFFDEGHYWADNTVWWEATDPSSDSINIDLQGEYTLDGFLVQADNNDVYVLSGDNGYIATVDAVVGSGLMTRRIVLSSAVTTGHLTLVALAGTGNGHDSSFACGEIQAFEGAVPAGPGSTPEPASLVTVGFGVIGLAVGARKKASQMLS